MIRSHLPARRPVGLAVGLHVITENIVAENANKATSP